MTEKTPQEKAAMERQTSLFEKAFENAKQNGGGCDLWKPFARKTDDFSSYIRNRTFQ